MFRQVSGFTSLSLHTLRGRVALFFVSAGVVTLGFFLYVLIQKIYFLFTNNLFFENILFLITNPLNSFFGLSSALLHLVGFFLYGLHVLGGETKPNKATWGMWFFGEFVDLITYDSMFGSHWSTNAGPFASMVGVFVISLVIVGHEIRSRIKKVNMIYQPLDKTDKYYFLPDITAFFLWLKGFGTLGNFISVGTTIVQYIPMYRETYRDPKSEQVGPWIFWSSAYLFTLLAVITGPGASNPALYFLPLYYLSIDVVMVWLCLRKAPNNEVTKKQ